MNQKTVTDFRYPRACRFRKYQIENRLWEYFSQSTTSGVWKILFLDQIFLQPPETQKTSN
jgi:hypothetical protein